MRHRFTLSLVLTVLALVGSATTGAAQQEPLAVPIIGEEKLAQYTNAYLEIAMVQEEMYPEFARPGNKTAEFQAELRVKLREEVHKVLQAQGLTPEEYAQMTWIISVDQQQMEAFQKALAARKEQAPPS